MKKRKRSKKFKQKDIGTLPAVLFGAGAGAVAAIIMLIIFSIICTFSADPEKLISPLSLVANGVAFFVCGFCASRRCRGALPAGLLSGAVLSVGYFIVSLFMDKELSWGLSLTSELLTRLSFVAVSLFGAIIAKAKR